MKYKYDEVKKFIEENTNCKILSNPMDYKNGNSKLLLECKCGGKFERTFYSIKASVRKGKEVRCKKCLHEYQKNMFQLSNEEAYMVIKNKLPEGFEIYEFDYKGRYCNIKLKHECGKIIENTFFYFRHNKITCECQKPNAKKDKNMLNDYIHSKGYFDYEVVKYVNTREVFIKHSVCGKVYTRTFDNIRANGLKCPHCNSNESLGSILITKYLVNNNISYVKEKKFNDCKDVNQLPFDFYLPDYNTCIEFDGIQHFEPVKHFGGIEKFEVRKKHDNIKNKYCYENSINLIRISYEEINDIDDILNKLIPR